MGGDGIGVVRLRSDPDRERAEYAIIVRTDRTGTGLGYRLMQEIIAYARSLGVKQIFGDVLTENERMLSMCAEFGFTREHSGSGPGVVQVVLNCEQMAIAVDSVSAYVPKDRALRRDGRAPRP